MGQALYRRYRSKKLSELVGQEHITTALARALKKGTVGHAYLFTGPRGTGKTSVARILAHEINSLPYSDEAIHLDIIEIDAASNRRIDEIRDLRDKVHIAPTSAKYKVYIIDEVHMLTREAFNALLKTLEEPPAHVIFILATTEVHKLPETIISRTQRFSFKPVELDKVVAHLKSIATQENIDIDDEALMLIAAHGEGSFRDSISLLDQVRNIGEKVDKAKVQHLLGIAPEALLAELLDAVTAGNASTVVASLRSLQEQGFEAPMIAKQLGHLLRERLVAGGEAALPHDAALKLLAELIDVPASRDPAACLEIALLDVTLSRGPSPAHTPAAKPVSEAKTMHEDVRAKPATQIEPHPSTFQRTVKADSAAAPVAQPEETATGTSAPAEKIPFDQAAWQATLDSIKKQYNTLYSILRATRPLAEGENLTLECGFAFHKKRLNESRNKQVIIDTIKAVTGQEITLNFVMAKEPVMPTPPASDEVVHAIQEKPKDDQTVKTISNIFGGAELIES